MNKRQLGNALLSLGSPVMLGTLGIMSSFSADGDPKNLFWAVPLTLLTLPLAPIYMQGSKLISECDQKDFIIRTRDLPRMTHLPLGYVSIDEFEGKFYLSPLPLLDDEGPFASMGEARSFLDNLGYREVVYMKSIEAEHPWEKYPFETYWIKKQ